MRPDSSQVQEGAGELGSGVGSTHTYVSGAAELLPIAAAAVVAYEIILTAIAKNIPIT